MFLGLGVRLSLGQGGNPWKSLGPTPMADFGKMELAKVARSLTELGGVL